MKTKKKFNILSILLLIAFFASNIAKCIHDFNYDQSSFDEVEKVDSGYDSPRRQIRFYITHSLLCLLALRPVL